MEEITHYTNLILSPEVQTLITPYRDLFVLVSLFFIIIALVFIFQEKYFISDAKRRVMDFLSDPRKYKKPRKFLKMWNEVDGMFKKGDYRGAIIGGDKLMLQILKRFSYVGKECSQIIDNYQIKEEALPNLEEIRRMSELKKALQKGEEVLLEKEEMDKLFYTYKQTLIKMGILEK